ncbi:MAG: hypothetical protein K6T34_09980, partial [Thermoflavifilum sp.]|nr:hypothetical protein [Thermoflavifilum sp.]
IFRSEMEPILAIFLVVLNFLCFFLCFKTKKEEYIILHQIKHHQSFSYIDLQKNGVKKWANMSVKRKMS